MQVGSLVALFALFSLGSLASPLATAPYTRLTGKWQNELGSTMIIFPFSHNGIINGSYHSAVGHASGLYPLLGQVVTQTNETNIVVSWSVVWQNNQTSTNSITTWIGQLYLDDSQEGDVITTTWLLTHGATWKDQWGSTQTWYNVFRRYNW